MLTFVHKSVPGRYMAVCPYEFCGGEPDSTTGNFVSQFAQDRSSKVEAYVGESFLAALMVTDMRLLAGMSP